jgi:predicted transcriptional regulator
VVVSVDPSASFPSAQLMNGCLLGKTVMSNIEDNVTALTAEIVSAYVANNSVQAANLSALIASVHTAVAGLGAPTPAEAPVPAADPKRSVRPDYIVCLEDGRRFKSLKRHLMAHFGLTPDEYRTKWNLPRDYPMVAPNYAAARSELARSMGLGRKPKAPVKAAAAKQAPGKAKRSKRA